MRDSTSTPSRSRSRRVTLVLVSLAALVLASCSGDQSAMHPQGPFAQRPHDLIVPVLWVALGVFVLVQGLIIYSVWRFRQREDDDGLPVQTHGNTKLEILWTVIPAVILAAIAVPTVQLVFELDAEPDDALVIEVIGHRWWWEYHYPGQDIWTANEMVVPVGQPVRLEMRAEESGIPDRGVIHSFWIPPLGGKQDVVPGAVTTLNIQADEPGRYLGQCAEYCGLSHANMRARVVAVPPDEFTAWLEAQTSGPVEAQDGTLAAQGRDLFAELGGGRTSCIACHAIGGDNRSGMTGPDLTHLMSRSEFAGAILALDEANLRDWLRDPLAMKPMQPELGIGMPDLDLTDDEVEALVAYLMILE